MVRVFERARGVSDSEFDAVATFDHDVVFVIVTVRVLVRRDLEFVADCNSESVCVMECDLDFDSSSVFDSVELRSRVPETEELPSAEKESVVLSVTVMDADFDIESE